MLKALGGEGNGGEDEVILSAGSLLQSGTLAGTDPNVSVKTK